MTIDEAIEITKQHNKCQFEESNECASIECCSDCDKYYDEKKWDEFCKQLAEWLEELKFLRTAKETMYREIYSKGRNDAIEEFVNLYEEFCNSDIACSDLSCVGKFCPRCFKENYMEHLKDSKK